jgi:uncharacterized protein (TIGR01244 family)
MSKKRLFLISFLLTTGVMLLVMYLDHRERGYVPDLTHLTNNVFVTSQLKPSAVRGLKIRRIQTIVDFRPDGEAADQTPSGVIESLSKEQGMAFHYIPVPHESIPDDAVDALRDVLSQGATPTVLYCRSGKRAARTFALAVASQADGPDLDEILGMVRAAGFSAEDLKSNITERISHRSSPQTPKN